MCIVDYHSMKVSYLIQILQIRMHKNLFLSFVFLSQLSRKSSSSLSSSSEGSRKSSSSSSGDGSRKSSVFFCRKMGLSQDALDQV